MRIKTGQTTNYRPTLQYLPAARRTDIIKPGYPGLEAVKPVNPGLKNTPGFAFPIHNPNVIYYKVNIV